MNTNTIDEKTTIPIWVIGSFAGLTVSIFGIVFAGAVAWGSLRTEVTEYGGRLGRQELALKEEREQRQNAYADVMSQIMILRQDTSEIKGILQSRGNK